MPDRVTAVPNGVEEYFTPGGRAVADAARARRRPLRPGEALPPRPRSRGAGAPRACPTCACGSSATGRWRASCARGSPTTTPPSGSSSPATSSAHRLPRRVPAGVGRAQRVARRGVGAVADRGRGVRRRRRSPPTSAAIAARWSTGRPGCSPPPERLGEALRTVLADDAAARPAGSAARSRARTLTWERTATGRARGAARRGAAASRPVS